MSNTISSIKYIHIKEKGTGNEIFIEATKKQNGYVDISPGYTKEEIKQNIVEKTAEIADGRLSIKSGGDNQEETFFNRATKNLEKALVVEVDKTEHVNISLNFNKETMDKMVDLFKGNIYGFSNYNKGQSYDQNNQRVKHEELADYFNNPNTEKALSLGKQDFRFTKFTAKESQKNQLNHDELAQALNNGIMWKYDLKYEPIENENQAFEFLLKKEPVRTHSNPFCMYIPDSVIENIHKADNFKEKQDDFRKILECPQESNIFKNKTIASNDELMKSLIDKNNYAFKFSSHNIKSDRELALKAVQITKDNYNYLSKDLKEDREIVKATIEKFPRILDEIPNQFSDDKEIVLKNIEVNSKHYYKPKLSLYSERLQNDKDVVLATVKKNPSEYINLSDKMKEDRDVVITTLKENSNLFKHVPKHLSHDKELVLEVIRENDYPLRHAPKEIQDLCKDKDPIQTLEKAIAYEKLKTQLKPKTDEKPAQKLKI